MAAIKDLSFLKKFHSQTHFKTYGIYGNESYTKSLCYHQLTEHFLPASDRPFNMVSLQMETASPDDFLDAVNTAPMFSEYRIVSVTDFSPSLLTAAWQNTLFDYIKSPNSSTILIFMFAESASAKSKPFKQLYQIIANHGLIIECMKKNKWELAPLLISYAKKKGKTLTRLQANQCIDRCSNDLQNLTIQLDKVIAYSKTDCIQTEDILMLTTPDLNSTAFDLANLILQKNGQKALHILEELYAQRIDPLQILGALNVSFIDLYRCNYIQRHPQERQNIIDAYGYKGKEFRLKKAEQIGRNYHLSQIKACIDILLETDIKIKTSPVQKTVILETALMQMLQIV